MILITGSTGQLGKATIELLLKKIPANRIAALARDESKTADLKQHGIEVRVGNYHDRASLAAAFKGIDKLLFISGNDVARRQQQHVTVVEAAKEAGVKHIIYTSFARKNETETNPLGIVATSHIETDKLVKASGIPYTIMQNGLYADVLPMFFGEKVLDTGIYLPSGNGKAAYIKREDIAKAAVAILTSEGHEGKEYKIVNTKNYSLQDAAGILSELSGKPVSYINPTTEEYKASLTQANVPADAVGFLASFSEAIKQGEFESSDSDIETTLGITPASLKDFFKEAGFSKN